MTKELPVLGAALSLDMIELHRDWLFESNRPIEIQSFCWPTTHDGDTPELVAQAKRLLDGHKGRRGLHGPFMSFRIDCADPEITPVIRHRLLRALEICADLAADQMVVHSPYGLWTEAEIATSAVAAAVSFERVRFVMGPVIDRAERLGVELVLENVEDTDPGLRARLAEALGSPAVKLSLDTGHAQMMHCRCGAPPVDAFALAGGAALRHVHLQDVDGFADRHWHPGEGNIPWKSVFAALNRLPQMPRLLLEVADPRALRQGADHLIGLGLAQ